MLRNFDSGRGRLTWPAAPPMGESSGGHQVVSGSMLCDLRVWSEAEWAELAERDRPREFVHAPGLGWVGAVPKVGLN